MTLSKHQELALLALGGDVKLTAAEVSSKIDASRQGTLTVLTTLRERGLVYVIGRKGVGGSGGPNKMRWALTEAGKKQYSELLSQLKN